MNQFFYKSGRSTEDNIIYDSFNINLVLRTTITEEGHLLVELNDGRTEEKIFWKTDQKTNEVIKNKEGIPMKIHTARNYVTSDMLVVDPEDIKRFREITEVVHYPQMSEFIQQL